MKKILVTGDFELPDSLLVLRQLGFRIRHLRELYSKDDLKKELNDTVLYILGGPEYLDRTLIDSSPLLKYLVVMGTGTLSFIDLDYAISKQIMVENTPWINAESVAEFALGVILASTSKLVPSIEGVRKQTAWLQKPRKSLNSSHIGFIGLGPIGQAIALKIRSVSKGNLSYFSRTRRRDLERDLNLCYLPLKDLLATVDVCTIQLRYCRETHHLIHSTHFDGRNPSLNLLNFSNPRIIDPKALSDALWNHSIAFAFIDGFYSEWVDNNGKGADPHQLLQLPSDRFLASSHIAAQEEGTVSKVLLAATERLTKYLKRNSDV